MKEQPGPTGKFPSGKLCNDDKGELKIEISIHDKDKVILINFGNPIGWVGLNPKLARDMAKALIDCANTIERVN